MLFHNIQEQLSVIRCLRSEGVKPIKIHQRMDVHYGDACLSLHNFMNGVGSS